MKNNNNNKEYQTYIINTMIKKFYLLSFFIILFFLYHEEFIIDKEWKCINDEFLNLAKTYEYLLGKKESISEDSPIWVMWYQGINKAPPIIKACIQSILIKRVNHPVILLDKSNIKKYIELPKYILKKFEDNIISITHFSDIVRMALLSRYGGFWIDSTYLVNTPLNLTNYSFYTLRFSKCYKTITKCKWSGNFLALPKNNFLSTYVYNSFLFYWKSHNKLINYFLIDYIIRIAYDNIKKFRDLTKKIPLLECNIFDLSNRLNDLYEEKEPIKCSFNKIYRRGNFHEFKNRTKTNFKYKTFLGKKKRENRKKV